MRTWLGCVVLCACATARPVPAPAPVEPPPSPRANAVRARALPFDVAACARPAGAAPVTKETLAGLLALERPRFDECLAAPSSREGPDASADVEVTVAAGVTARVTPRRVAPPGVTCLEGRAASLGLGPARPPVVATVVATPPRGAPTGEVPLLPEVDAARAAVTAACACFEPLGGNAPPQLVLRLGPGAPVDVVTASDPLAAKLEQCLEAALAAHPPPGLELTLDLPLLNGDAAHESPDATPEVAALQLDAMTRRRAARLQLLEARRSALVAVLAPLGRSYKRKPTPALVRARTEGCEALRDVDEELVIARARAGAGASPAAEAESTNRLCGAVPPGD